MLADFGADVIRIEPPAGVDPNEAVFAADRMSGDFQNLNRNKRSLTLNLKKPEGLEVFKRLVKHADVVVENWRPDVKERLGLITKRCAPSIPALSSPAFPVLARTAPMRGAPASTRSSRAWPA